jgi:tryptophan halogenase
MGERIEDVTVVGGGDSGLLAALALKQMNPGLDVSVVDNFGQEIPQVDKSTFLAIQHILHDNLDIDEQSFVEEVNRCGRRRCSSGTGVATTTSASSPCPWTRR